MGVTPEQDVRLYETAMHVQLQWKLHRRLSTVRYIATAMHTSDLQARILLASAHREGLIVSDGRFFRPRPTDCTCPTCGHEHERKAS